MYITVAPPQEDLQLWVVNPPHESCVTLKGSSTVGSRLSSAGAAQLVLLQLVHLLLPALPAEPDLGNPSGRDDDDADGTTSAPCNARWYHIFEEVGWEGCCRGWERPRTVHGLPILHDVSQSIAPTASVRAAGLCALVCRPTALARRLSSHVPKASDGTRSWMGCDAPAVGE
jgi:hypothetical protein